MICIDTMVLIWGLQKRANPQQIQMVERTGRWLRSLPASERIMTPSVVVAEYLAKFNGAAKVKQLKALEQTFFVPALDLASAALASELMAKAPKAELKHLSREVIKSDCYILATAIVHGASVLVTDNRDDFIKLTGSKIRVEAIPDVPEQHPLELIGAEIVPHGATPPAREP